MKTAVGRLPEPSNPKIAKPERNPRNTVDTSSIRLTPMKLYTLKQSTVICPKCELTFATTQVAKMPKIALDSRVEADLHRVLPDAAIRASLIAMCPECVYTWWLSAFAPHFMLPQMVPDSPPIDNAKKFGHAVASGRKFGAHSLDRAIVALNGYWAAREDFQVADKWLELAARELDEALNDDSWAGNRGRYQYIMGEVLRLMGDFHGAVRFYNSVDRRSVLPKELIDHQIISAKSGDSTPTFLPPHIIEAIFLPKPAVEHPSTSALPNMIVQGA